MKKVLIVFSAFILMFLMTSCSKEKNKQKVEESTEPTALLEEEADYYAKKIAKGRLGSLKEFNEKEKAEIKKELENEGYTVVFNDDGSGLISNEDGQWYIGKGWNDTDYTDGVPAVDFGTITMSSEEKDNQGNSYIFLVRDVTSNQAADYVEKLKKAGFEEQPGSAVDAKSGVVQFIGKNKSGKTVNVGYSSRGFTVRIYK